MLHRGDHVRLAKEGWPRHRDTLPGRGGGPRYATPYVAPPLAPDDPRWRAQAQPDAGGEVFLDPVSTVKEGGLTVGYGRAVFELGQPMVRFVASEARFIGRGGRALVPASAILEPERLDPAELTAALAHGPALEP